MNKYKYHPEEIPCMHYRTWQENQAPLGSGMNWPETFEDCVCDSEDPKFIEYIERDDPLECSPKCPGYQPMEVATCKKHGEYLQAEGCHECMWDKEQGR